MYRLLKLDFSILAALTEETSPSSRASFNHIAESGFVASSLFTDETEGRSAAGGNRQILHILILLAKSLINLTQDREAPLQLSRTKRNVSEQALSWDRN